MKNNILACLLLSVSFSSQAVSVLEKPLSAQCNLAIAESNASSEALSSLLNRWLNDDTDILSINSSEFDRYKKSHFDPQYKAIVNKYKVTDTATLEQLNTSPILRSNDITLRVRLIVNAFQRLTKNKDKDDFRNSYKPLKSAILDNESFIKKACSDTK